jgi:hypothetical protein
VQFQVKLDARLRGKGGELTVLAIVAANERAT